MDHHHYRTKVTWTGNSGEGTSSYKSYKRQHIISVEGKQDIAGSAMPEFRGDADMHNPEDLLMASVSACHMLWYLHQCAVAGIVVTAYEDHAEGIMVTDQNGSGYFTEITLKPIITLADPALKNKADELHKKANQFCFIANSLNFPVHHQATYQ